MFVRNKLFIYVLVSMLIIPILSIQVYADTGLLSINGESAILMDAKSGEVLYSKNPNTRQYPASITKLITALVAIENQKPTDIVTMSKEAIFSIERGSSHIGLDVGEQITFDQALHALLLQSANEVANGIAELSDGSISAFAQHLTARAKELGAKDTNFTNPHGLHDPNHYTTAYDMALIAKEVNTKSYFQEIMSHSTYQIPPTNKCSEIRYLSQQHRLMNEQRDGRMYRKDVIAGKTGYTDQAGNTLVTIAKRGDMELIAVVLKSDRYHLYSDTNTLLDYGFENYKSISLHTQEDIISTVPMYTIKSGQLIHTSDCDIALDKDVNLIVPKDIKERKVNSIISLPDRIKKGASIGDIVGTITYTYEEKPITTHNLVISNFNYMSSSEPFAFPEKPKYTIPSMDTFYSMNTLLILVAAFVIGSGVLLLHARYSYNTKYKKGKNKLLRFSKTIK